MASSALRRERSFSALDAERFNFRSQIANAARSHSALGPNPEPYWTAHMKRAIEIEEVHATRRSP
jgi:hypothetical protein